MPRDIRQRNAYWNNLDRVNAGLLLAARELYGDDPERLPRQHDQYAGDVRGFDHKKQGPHRRYPPAHRILLFYESMTAAWCALGLIAEDQVWKLGTTHWTRALMIEAGAAFYQAHGFAPTNDAWWQEMVGGTADTETGHSNNGSRRPYPSCTTIQREWNGMRAFWLSVIEAHPELGINLDHTDLPWTPLATWFITESVGILPREEVARLLSESGMGRTEAAIKRRLYDLGVNAYNRWGWTLHKVTSVLGVSLYVLEGYLSRGDLPFFRGAKCIYVDPADLLVIREYNWSKKRHPRELERDVRASLMQRLCYALLRYDWRRYSYHRPRPGAEYHAGRPARVRQPRPEAKPTHIKTGQWVRFVGEWRFKTPGAKERVGHVTRVFWSPERARATQKAPARPACWMAAVEVRQVSKRGRTKVGYRRTCYNVPLDQLERTRKPYPRKATPSKVDGRT